MSRHGFRELCSDCPASSPGTRPARQPGSLPLPPTGTSLRRALLWPLPLTVRTLPGSFSPLRSDSQLRGRSSPTSLYKWLPLPLLFFVLVCHPSQHLSYWNHSWVSWLAFKQWNEATWREAPSCPIWAQPQQSLQQIQQNDYPANLHDCEV